uniref:PAX-interacting protein 1 n=1 Tax=Cacopsylla melanoneura TaxID=428564 RepID=A0A8D9BRL0_9HEMI
MEEDEREEEEGEDEMVGSPSLLPTDSPSLLDQDTADNTGDVEASSKNTTNYDISEMDLDSFISGPETEARKVINKRTIENSLDNNSSSLFSVSETELRPDFVQEEDDGPIKQPAGKCGKTSNTHEKDDRNNASGKTNAHDKDNRNNTTSTGPKPRKPITRGVNKTSEDSENSPEPSKKTTKNDKDKRNKETESPEHRHKAREKDQKDIHKHNEKHEKKPAKKVLTKKRNAKNRIESSSSGSSTESDFEFQVNEKINHDTIQANQSEETTSQTVGNGKHKVVSKADKSNKKQNSEKGKDSHETTPLEDDFFDMATQKITGKGKGKDSHPKPSEEDFFEMATQKVSIGPSETDDSFVAPTQVNKDFFEMATQQVSSKSAPTPKEKTNEDFFDMATQKIIGDPTSDSENEESTGAPTRKKTPNVDFFEAATQQVSVNRVSEDLFEAATQPVRVEKSHHEDQGSDEDLFNAPTQRIGDTKQDDTKSSETNDKRVDKQESKKVKESLRNDSESSNFSFDSEVGKKKTNVRNNRKRNMKEKELDIPEEIDDECGKSKRNQRKVDKMTINTRTNVINKNKPESSKETSRKRNVKETPSEESSDECEITFQPQKKTKTPPKRETRTRKKNPKYEDDEDMKTKASKNLNSKSTENDTEEEKSQPNKNIEHIKTDTKKVSENINENESKPQRNKRGRKPVEKKVNDSETETPHVDEQMDEENVQIKTTPSRRRRHPLATTHGIESSPQVCLDRIGTPFTYIRKRNVTRDLTETIAETKTPLETSNPEDIASNDKSKTSKSKPKDKPLEQKTNLQSNKRHQVSSNSNVQDETFTIEESSSMKDKNSKTKTSSGNTPAEENTKKSVDTSRRRGCRTKDKPETNSKTEEEEDDISENLNHGETTRGGKKMKIEEKKGESEELPDTKSRSRRMKKEDDIPSENIPEKKNAKRGRKKEEAQQSTECSNKKKVKNSEDTEECNESQGTSRSRTGKLSSKRQPTPPVTLKRKELPVEESPMKPPCAPSTPKKARVVKDEPGSSVKATPRGGLSDASVRSSPRSRGRKPPDGANSTRGRTRSTSSSSDSVASDSTSSSSRRSTVSVKKTSEIRVTFTMVDKPAKYTTLLASLNGSITDDPIISDILVTPKVARSLKFLQFLAMGKPIVTIKWLVDSERCQKFLPHEKYILKDTEAEKMYGFKLEQSIACARRSKLLDNYSVFVTNSVKPTPADMKGIIECSGGTFIPKAPSHWAPYSIIVADPADSAQLGKLLGAPGSKPSVVNKEFILSGILQQKLDFVKYGF